jgi:hypothetical protein
VRGSYPFSLRILRSIRILLDSYPARFVSGCAFKRTAGES